MILFVPIPVEPSHEHAPHVTTSQLHRDISLLRPFESVPSWLVRDCDSDSDGDGLMDRASFAQGRQIAFLRPEITVSHFTQLELTYTHFYDSSCRSNCSVSQT